MAATPLPLRDLTVLAYGNGVTCWHARVTSLGDVAGPTFLSVVADLLTAGDVMLCSMAGAAVAGVVGAALDGSVSLMPLGCLRHLGTYAAPGSIGAACCAAAA